MVTKAELEAEVAELRRQLAEQAAEGDRADPSGQGSQSASGTSDTGAHDMAENLDALATQFEGALAELEDLPHKKPILFALGVFTLGYLIGRSR